MPMPNQTPQQQPQPQNQAPQQRRPNRPTPRPGGFRLEPRLNQLSNLLFPSLRRSLRGKIPTNFDQFRQGYEDKIYQNFQSRLNPQFEQQYNQFEQDLANKGIPMGSELYNKQLEQFNRDKSDAYRQAQLTAMGASGDEAQRMFEMNLKAREQPLTEFLALQDPSLKLKQLALQKEALKRQGGGGGPDFFQKLDAQTQANIALMNAEAQLAAQNRPDQAPWYTGILGGLGTGIGGNLANSFTGYNPVSGESSEGWLSQLLQAFK